MKPIHNLLRQRLQRTRKPIIEHPPIDLLSAFTERALSGFENASVLEHLAQCGDCRKIVFLAAPENSNSNYSLAPVHSTGWISWPVLRWASAAACAVIVVVAVGLRPRHQTEGYRADQMVNRAAPDSASKASADENAAKVSGAVQVSNPLTPNSLADATAVPARAKESPDTSGLEDRFTGAAEMPGVHSEQVSFVQSSRRSPRWTLTADGTLERSLDNGITWQRVPVPRVRRFHAVAADGLHVWLGGTRGVLLHSPDAGQHWQKIRPAVGNDDLIADIIAIEFDDARHGMLTTFGDGTWTTSDGGQSWIRE